MSRRPLFEAVESRRMMSVVPVLNTADFGPGSLRQAVINAAPGDTVDMTGISGTINLIAGPLTIDKDITLIGPGQDKLTLHGGLNDPVVLNVNFDLVIKGVTLTGGKSTASSGGGVFNRGALELDNVTVKENQAYLYGGGVFSRGRSVVLNDCTFLNNFVSGALEASGGGLYIQGGTLTMRNCTFTQNKAIGASNTTATSGPGTGGGIYLENTLDSTITNCTFGDNTAQGGTGGAMLLNGQGFGGAIYTDTTHATLLNHCTIAYNSAKGGGNAQLNTLAISQGGGVYSASNTTGVTLQDTIAALNTASNQPDVVNTLINTLGHNLIGIYSGTVLRNSMLGDKIGSALQPYAPGISATLSTNGGTTMTYAVLDDSPAINAASTLSSPPRDQRGLGRRDLPDIGAFELNANHLPAIAAPSIQAVAGTEYSQVVATSDADGDNVVVTSANLPNFLTIRTVNGVTSFVGTPTEADAGSYRIELQAYDGYQTVTTTFKLKVGIAGIDLNPVTGLLRLNGTEFDDDLYITTKDGFVNVFRDGFKRQFALADVKAMQIYGFGGNDTILADVGTLPAYVSGGDGNDTITNGDGDSYITGGAGDDVIHGGGGRDRINGDDGRDKLYGESGSDVLHGGAGNDFLDGGAGRNRLFGDAGNDLLNSLLGNRDTVYGGDGDDIGTWNKSSRIADDIKSM